MALNVANNASRAAIAVSGAVNRLGIRAPAANPSALKAAIATAPTTTGHQSGCPAAPCEAVTAYRAPTQAR